MLFWTGKITCRGESPVNVLCVTWQKKEERLPKRARAAVIKSGSPGSFQSRIRYCWVSPFFWVSDFRAAQEHTNQTHVHIPAGDDSPEGAGLVLEREPHELSARFQAQAPFWLLWVITSITAFRNKWWGSSRGYQGEREGTLQQGGCLYNTMEYYSAIKKKAFESVLMRWMKLDPIIESEVSQKEKNKHHALRHVNGI